MSSTTNPLASPTLQHTSGPVPWDEIDAAIEAVVAEPSLVSYAFERFKAITADPYTIETFEYYYLPFILTTAAKRLPPDLAQSIYTWIIDELEMAGDLDDDALLEFFMYCGIACEAPILPAAFNKVSSAAFDTHASCWFHMWGILDLAIQFPNDPVSMKICDYALKTLRRAEDGGISLDLVIPAADIAASLHLPPAESLIESILAKNDQSNDPSAWEVREYREALDIFRGNATPHAVDHSDLRGAVAKGKASLEEWYSERPDDWNDVDFGEPDDFIDRESPPESTLDPAHQSLLSDTSDRVPWDALEALAAQGIADPSLAQDLLDRLNDLYLGDPYASETFEIVYLPCVLTLIARGADPATRTDITAMFIEKFLSAGESDDDGAREFFTRCLHFFPIDDLAKAILKEFNDSIDPLESLDAYTFWSLLERLAGEGAPELQEKAARLAIETLTVAEAKDITGAGAQSACYLLAALKRADALPLMETQERRTRERGGFHAIEANGMRECIQILRGELPPCPSRQMDSLRTIVERERESYVEWYRNGRQTTDLLSEADLAERFDRMCRALDMPPLPPDELPVAPIRNTEPKIGRNDPCPCGSGKKYKKCHGK